MLSGDPANKPLNRIKREGMRVWKRGEKRKGREKDIAEEGEARGARGRWEPGVGEQTTPERKHRVLNIKGVTIRKTRCWLSRGSQV